MMHLSSLIDPFCEEVNVYLMIPKIKYFRFKRNFQPKKIWFFSFGNRFLLFFVLICVLYMTWYLGSSLFIYLFFFLLLSHDQCTNVRHFAVSISLFELYSVSVK